LSRDELTGKTGDLPVDQVLKSLDLRWRFSFREQDRHLFLLVFIRAFCRSQQRRACIDHDKGRSTATGGPRGGRRGKKLPGISLAEKNNRLHSITEEYEEKAFPFSRQEVKEWLNLERKLDYHTLKIPSI